MKLFTQAYLAWFALASPASAQDARQDMSNNAQAEISVCLAYYSIVLDCAGNDPRGRVYAEAAARELGKMSAKASEDAHLKPSDVRLRFDLNVLAQRTFMGDSCSGAKALRARYADQCGELLKDPYD